VWERCMGYEFFGFMEFVEFVGLNIQQ